MRKIGIVGTAKNTGKTTTAVCLLDQLQQAQIPAALTSIGYDGENFDLVTGLPKPRYNLQQGMLVATAEECLSAGTAVLDVVEVLPVRTILGPVCITRVTKAGTVLVAGPNRRVDLELLYERVQAAGAQITLIDGALNRLAPLIGADGLIIATGAAFDTSVEAVAEHMQAIAAVVEQVEFSGEFQEDLIQVIYADRTQKQLSTGSLLNHEGSRELEGSLNRPVIQVTIPGACDPDLFQAVLDSSKHLLVGGELIFGDPLKIIASGDPRRWQKLFRELHLSCITILYHERISIRFVTVNPFYPHLVLQTRAYQPAYVDARGLITAVQSRLNAVPVFNILDSPQPDLLSLIGFQQEISG